MIGSRVVPIRTIEFQSIIVFFDFFIDLFKMKFNELVDFP